MWRRAALETAPRARRRALRARDVDWIDRTVPLVWPLLKAWFRPDVRGLERIPADGPVLLVGNHSGGNVAPDTLVFTTAFIRHFGARRPFFQLAHRLVVAAPWLRLLRRYGTVIASHENARAALRAGAAVLVYPGGDWETHRPVWKGIASISTAITGSCASHWRPECGWFPSSRSAARRRRCF